MAIKTEAVAENGAQATPLIAISRIAEETLSVPIVGTSPLIMHKFAEKAKKQMLDAMQGRRTPKEPKEPEKEYEGCFYKLEDGRYGFPADAFKQATVGSARFYGKEVTMKGLNQFLFFRGEVGDDGRQMVAIDGEASMREDIVRVGNGGSDIRYRPQFWPWSASLEVTFFTSVLTRDSVLSFIDAGGLALGIGDWRPEKRGTFGTYRIDTDQDIKVL